MNLARVHMPVSLALCLLAGCGSARAHQNGSELNLGLFEVVDRHCEDLHLLEAYPCERTAYVELRREPEFRPNGLALLVWDRWDDEYAYAAHSVDGDFVSAHEYLLEDHDLGSRSLWVEGRELLEYRSFTRRGSHESTDPRENERAAHDPVALAKAREVIASMRLMLKRVARTPALDALLQYPPPD